MTSNCRGHLAPGTDLTGDGSIPRLSRRHVFMRIGALALMATACQERNTIESLPPYYRIRPLEHGVFLPEGPQAGPTYAAMVGFSPQWMLLFRDWTHEVPPLGSLDAVLAQGCIPVLTWEPWHAPPEGTAPSNATHQPRFALARLLSGDHDQRIHTWAEALASWGRKVVLRFAHEMNGDWYPWGVGVQGNTADQYVRAWHYVHDRFVSAGADNVRWCWAPNAPAPREDTSAGARLEDFYPGRKAVDLLGIDGYNWGSTTPSMTWTDPVDLFALGLEELRALRSNLPILVTETASAEAAEPGRSKAAWIARLFDFLDQQGDVRAIIWFQEHKEHDWRLNSSPAAQAAYRRALKATR